MFKTMNMNQIQKNILLLLYNSKTQEGAQNVVQSIAGYVNDVKYLKAIGFIVAVFAEGDILKDIVIRPKGKEYVEKYLL